MVKDTFYFPHDYTPTDDPKTMGLLSEYGAAGYGLYWRIVEMLHVDPSHTLQLKPYLLAAIAKQMGSTSDFLLQFISDCVGKFELFKQDNDCIFSERVIRNISKREDILSKRKAAAVKGGQASAKQRLTKRQPNVNDFQPKERKGKEKKEKESKVLIAPTADEVVAYFSDNGYRAEIGLKAFNYYNDANWTDSKGRKVLNWKQKMQGNWFKPENEGKTQITVPKNSKRTYTDFANDSEYEKYCKAHDLAPAYPKEYTPIY